MYFDVLQYCIFIVFYCSAFLQIQEIGIEIVSYLVLEIRWLQNVHVWQFYHKQITLNVHVYCNLSINILYSTNEMQDEHYSDYNFLQNTELNQYV